MNHHAGKLPGFMAALLLALPVFSNAAPTEMQTQMTVGSYLKVYNQQFDESFTTPIEITFDSERNKFTPGRFQLGFWGSKRSGIVMTWKEGHTISAGADKTIPIKLGLYNGSVDYGWMALTQQVVVPVGDVGWGANNDTHESTWFYLYAQAETDHDRPQDGEYTGSVTVGFSLQL
jgi:hypothetical protein